MMARYDQEALNPLRYLSLQDRLYRRWYEYNFAYFKSALQLPEIIVDEIPAPKPGCWLFGRYRPRKKNRPAQIVLQAAMLAGYHIVVRSGDAYATGRFHVIADTLLHEMIHQYQCEVLLLSGYDKNGKRANYIHGQAFREQANFIGLLQGLPPVFSNRAPYCQPWPHNVRPLSYYGGAYIDAYPLGWVVHHWPLLATCAWQGYTRQGPGLVAVVVNGQHDILAHAYQARAHSVSLWGKSISPDWMTTRVTRELAEYDPATEILVVEFARYARFSMHPHWCFRVPTPAGCDRPELIG